MEATASNIKLLRKLIHERIPDQGLARDTRFLEEDLEELLQGANNIYYAASEGWMMKAGMYQEEMQGLRTSRSGMTTYEMTRLMHRLEYAKSLSNFYLKRARKGGAHAGGTGSMIMDVQRPEV